MLHRSSAIAAIAFTVLGATGAWAADFVEPALPIYDEPSDLGVYALLYGGYVGSGVINVNIVAPPINVDANVDAGWGIGGAVGIGVVEGLSLEIDAFHTNRPVGATNVLYTTSLMANVKATLDINDVFGIYAGAGVGGIYVYADDGTTPDSGWGAGYQAMIGATANVSENIAVFGELRHQNAFSPILMESSGGGEFNLTLGGINAVLVGIRVGM